MANNPKAKDNLKPPWPKGKSGNPAGRPPGKSMTSIIREFKENKKRMVIEGKRKDWTYGELLILKMWEKGIKGDFPSQKYICDRLDGMPIAKHEIDGRLEALGNIKVYLNGKDPE